MITCKRRKQWRDTPEFFLGRMMTLPKSWKGLLTQMKFSDNNSIEGTELWVFRTKISKNLVSPTPRLSTPDPDLQSKMINTLALPSDALPHSGKPPTPEPRPVAPVATNSKATAELAIPAKADKSHLQENPTDQEVTLHSDLPKKLLIITEIAPDFRDN